jgi:peptide-methionine (S)-S-oxide reductase
MNMKTAYLAGGCFWGLEELFREQPGVTDTEVGYSGGENSNPTYQSHPGHAETLAITYDPTKTSFEALLDFFFRIHDPTTRNRQGNDVGSSYRSAIFYQDDDELRAAESVIEKVNRAKLYKHPVVTSLEKFKAFYSAEEYHQDYLRKNPGGYTCHYVRTDTSLL